jgi:Tol biopolymer transport system component/predicted Ser/Thr protein kinase
MGEVYRARDTRLGRDVAIKVIRSDLSHEPDRTRRFEQEARAAGALNHPNVCAIYDVGTDGGFPYVVMEFLEGESLQERLASGAIPLRKALDYAAQIAHGLSAAHEKGIIHRDLKPGNVFVTKSGRVKVLDFGLAKLTRPDTVLPSGDAPTAAATETGVILGTLGYMSPEQVRGQAADHRSDIFSLGAILYEMLSGKRAFHASTPVETLNAILKEDPPSLPTSGSGGALPPTVELIVRRCLEKVPEQRFQSASDVAFALERLTGSAAATRAGAATTRPAWARPWAIWVAGGLAAGLLVAAGSVIALRTGNRPQPSFERLTFRRGILSSARFSTDGATIVYSAAWDGEPTRVYSTRLDSRESSPLGLPDARLLSVSPAGELAIAIGPGSTFAAGPHATLARVPLAGGAPREIANGVSEADWAPGDRGLAVVHYYTNRMSLEYPSGKDLWQTTTGILSPRVSPRGDLVAFVEMASRSDFSRGYVAVVDRAGRVRRLSGLWETIGGIAWGPHGDEVWFTGVHRGTAKELWAVSLQGRERLILRTPGGITLQDVSSDGRALVSRDNLRMSLVALPPGEARERDLSWQDMTGVAGLSADGRRLIFTESSEAYGKNAVIGMRDTDGSPVVHLGEGYAGGLSPDGKWVVAITYGARPHLSLLPTGAGQSRELDPGPVQDYDWSCWTPGSDHVLFDGIESGHGARAYIQSIAGGPPRAVTPEGVPGMWRLISPDGLYLMGCIQDSIFLYPLNGGDPRYVPSLHLSDGVIQWLPDGKSVLVGARNGLPVHVDRIDLATGQRRRVRDLAPSDPAGVSEIVQIMFTPDTRVWAYSYRRILSDLYLVTGLR